MKEVIYDIETRTAFQDLPGDRRDPSRRSELALSLPKGQALATLGMSIAGTWGDRETRRQGDRETRKPIACKPPIIPKVTLSPPLLVPLSQIVAHDAGRAREPLDFRTFDLLADLQLRLGHRVSLDQLAEGLGTSKTGNGLLAVEWWKARQALMGIADILSDTDDRQRLMQLADHFYRRLKHYCIADVELTRDVYHFGLEHGFVYYCYHGERYQVAVDWRPQACAASRGREIMKLLLSSRNHISLALLVLMFLTAVGGRSPAMRSVVPWVEFPIRNPKPALSPVEGSEIRNAALGLSKGPHCNLPPPPVWPPDGCPDYAAIAPPATPIPPACVADARVERWDEDGTPVIELSIYVDHPEIGPGARTYTKLVRYHVVNPKSEIPNPKSEWELVDLSWEVDCGKDEGPLTWASLQVLSGNASAGLSIYQHPLPAWYIALLMELSGRPRLYLPLIQKGSR